MPELNDLYAMSREIRLGTMLNELVPGGDQQRQRAEADEILQRLRSQAGVILADEVGMGKTFVALAISYSIAARSRRGPVIVMVPANLVEKWIRDLKTFCELYVEGRRPVRHGEATQQQLKSADALRIGVARHSVELLKLLDDPASVRCQFIFLTHGAMARRQSDKWVRLALVAEALRRHGRGKAARLIQVKQQVHRFLAELLRAKGEEKASDWGETVWQDLLRNSPSGWKEIYNSYVSNPEQHLSDDPVPQAIVRALSRVELKQLAASLEQMPVRARGGTERIAERISGVRETLRTVEQELWNQLLSQSRWRSPLLVMDEAHHLKNPGTSLARHLQSPDAEQDLRTGDGAMARKFDRMLFLTATPFQLGHHELVRVLERFGDVHWDEKSLGNRAAFHSEMAELSNHLNECQRSAIRLQKCWEKLVPEDHDEDDAEAWWKRIESAPRETLPRSQRDVLEAFERARQCRDKVQSLLRRWIMRHGKTPLWPDTKIRRRQRFEGAHIIESNGNGGLPIPSDQLLPFFMAARSAVNPGQDLLGEALCSSYEAFRFTRQNRESGRDDQDEQETPTDLSHSRWYLSEFDLALSSSSGATHPKLATTVGKAVDLWEWGEKVLIFAFYRQTCRALWRHLSQEIERRIPLIARRRFEEAGSTIHSSEVDQLLTRIQDRYFDKTGSPGRRALDDALNAILESHRERFQTSMGADQHQDDLLDVMRRFLRVTTTLVRCFPIVEFDSLDHPNAVAMLLDHEDASGDSWRRKFDRFLVSLTRHLSVSEGEAQLQAVSQIQTGGIRVQESDGGTADGGESTGLLANVRMANGETAGETRTRLMSAFNTPFFPDILVCSQVMGEGVDLQRFCRFVIHHDLDWNPSTIEQRTGRIDRLGCKAEGRHSIAVYLPYLAGAADERQFRVMSDRERWFRVVMGEDEVAKLITAESSSPMPLPESVTNRLNFSLGLEGRDNV